MNSRLRPGFSQYGARVLEKALSREASGLVKAEAFR
jgi:hypothetical protein